MNMTASFLVANKEPVTPEIGKSYRVVFNKRHNFFVSGAIYEVIALYDGYVKFKGYKLTFLETSIKLYNIN